MRSCHSSRYYIPPHSHSNLCVTQEIYKNACSTHDDDCSLTCDAESWCRAFGGVYRTVSRPTQSTYRCWLSVNTSSLSLCSTPHNRQHPKTKQNEFAANDPERVPLTQTPISIAIQLSYRLLPRRLRFPDGDRHQYLCSPVLPNRR